MIRLSEKEVTLTRAKSSENPFPDVLLSARAPASWWLILIVMWQFKGWIHIKSVLTKFASTVMFYDRFVKRKNNKVYVETNKAIWFHVCNFYVKWHSNHFRGKIYWLFKGNSTVWSYFSYCYKRISITKQIRGEIIANACNQLSLIQEAKHISSS